MEQNIRAKNPPEKDLSNKTSGIVLSLSETLYTFGMETEIDPKQPKMKAFIGHLLRDELQIYEKTSGNRFQEGT